jgi:hypothetical protein
MKSNCRKKSLTFGEFVARVCYIRGERKAGGFVPLVVKSHLIEFRGHQRLVIF